MVSYPPSALLRNATTSASPYLRTIQRRWAQVHENRFRFLATQRDQILEKYKDKLELKAQELGLQNTSELREVFKDKIDTLKNESAAQITLPSSSSNTNTLSNSPFPTPPQPPKPIPSSIISRPAIKTLSAFLDIEKTRELPRKEIEAIWRLRHVNNTQSLCAVISSPIYQKLEATARKYPIFILPLPREGKATEFHFLQWVFSTEKVVTILFTHLAEYKLRGEYSQPHTVVTHHLELSEEKGLVLLRGEVTQGRGVSVDDAKCLLLCMQKFYGGLGEGVDSVKRRDLLKMFARGDMNFKVEDLLDEAEKIF